ncbi:MAG: cysteine desulfurase family protein [Salibacteraceae bacterium]
MRTVYLDNAATTPIDPLVVEEMLKYMREEFGNPSSTHAFGRRARAAIDIARKRIAAHIHAEPGEIIFTSGGTEADNMAINCAVNHYGVRHVISSPIEHHAVLHPLEYLDGKGTIRLSLVKVDEKGNVDINHLEQLLGESEEKTLVSLMHANNELGNLIPIKQISDLCSKHNALFHSDTVQSIGHYEIDANDLNVDFMVCAPHKFHGPKGVGFLYVNKRTKASPLIFGGGQERNLRAGTENVYGIMGMAKALDIAYENLSEHAAHIKGIRDYMKSSLMELFPEVTFNGNADDGALYTLLNVCLPPTDKKEMLLFNLDIEGIAASGGSACSSGSDIGSHVLRAIGAPTDRPSIRFSFSKYTTREDIDYTLEKLKAIYEVATAA